MPDRNISAQDKITPVKLYSGTGGYAIMVKGRKTTFDKRVILQYCIAHNHNYKEISKKY